jgi:hypothetical protein
MRLRVREQGGEVHVEVDGVAGRQQRVLQALSECQRRATAGALPAAASDVNIRAGADRMRIRMKGRGGLSLEAEAIYQCLRTALLEHGAAAGTGAPAP